LHTHAATLLLAVAVVFSSMAQLLHAEEPVVALYVPTAQAVHAWPSAPV
jgi:hypothetical protein